MKKDSLTTLAVLGGIGLLAYWWLRQGNSLSISGGGGGGGTSQTTEPPLLANQPPPPDEGGLIAQFEGGQPMVGTVTPFGYTSPQGVVFANVQRGSIPSAYYGGRVTKQQASNLRVHAYAVRHGTVRSGRAIGSTLYTGIIGPTAFTSVNPWYRPGMIARKRYGRGR